MKPMHILIVSITAFAFVLVMGTIGCVYWIVSHPRSLSEQGETKETPRDFDSYTSKELADLCTKKYPYGTTALGCIHDVYRESNGYAPKGSRPKDMWGLEDK